MILENSINGSIDHNQKSLNRKVLLVTKKKLQRSTN
jgi:hypothetical protein